MILTVKVRMQLLKTGYKKKVNIQYTVSRISKDLLPNLSAAETRPNTPECQAANTRFFKGRQTSRLTLTVSLIEVVSPRLSLVFFVN